MIRTRVVTAADKELLLQLFAESRKQELAAFSWTKEEEDAFIHMQYNLQQRSYATRYSSSKHLMILQETTPVGHIHTAEEENSIRLLDISILQSYRNCGIGNQVIQALKEEAATMHASILLHVYFTNPAKEFYARRGFTVTHFDGVYYTMEWQGR